MFAFFIGFAASAQNAPFALPAKSTVVFYGDSITAQHLYTRFVEDFTLTRYPGLEVRFINAGVPGDTVTGGYAGTVGQRVARDVAPFHPSMVTVMLGMNDGGWGYTPRKPMLENFEKGYASLLESIRKASPSTQFTLIAPTPYDEITHGTEFPGYSGSIHELSDAVSRIANGMQRDASPKPLQADFSGPVGTALDCAQNRFPTLAPILIPDRIHPSEVTHWIMAAALMKAWRVDPRVSTVTLDFANGSLTSANRAEVRNLRKVGQGLQWNEKEEALPLPLDLNNAMTAVMLSCSAVADLDKEMLQVEGLKAGTYDLLIDGKTIASYSGAELASGINLALQKTPMLAEARAIDWLEERRGALDQAGLVLKADVAQTPSSGTARDQLLAAQDELAKTVREKLKAKTHQFEIKLH